MRCWSTRATWGPTSPTDVRPPILELPILELDGVGRRYGGVLALDGVGFAVPEGQALAICGDNGAGKSTLIRILSGALAPSAGTLALSGRRVRFASPADALAQGVATIYQDLALAPRLAVYQNVYLGAELRRPLLRSLGLPFPRVLDKPGMRAGARDLLRRLRARVPDVDRPVELLSGGQRQAVAIARALRRAARIVIMDEPTAALGVSETRQVLDLIREIKAQGITVLLVSHAMDDVIAVADRALVLRGGRLVADTMLAGWTADRLADAIRRPDLGEATP